MGTPTGTSGSAPPRTGPLPQRPSPRARPLARWRSPRDWSLLVKLAIVLLVPGLLAVVLGGLRITDQAARAGELDRVARFGAAQGDVEALLHRLQTERLRVTAFVADGRRADPQSLNATFADVTAAGAGTAPTVEALYADDPGLVGVDRATRQGLARLDGLRSLALTSNAPASAVTSRYTDLINIVSELDDQLLRGVNTTVTNGLTGALSGLAVARNEASLQQALVNAATSAQGPVRPAIDALLASNARLSAGLADFRAALDVGQRVRYAGLIADASNTQRGGVVAGVAAQDGTRPLAAGAAGNYGQVYDAFLAEIDQTEDGVRTELTTQTSADRSAAISQAVLNTVLVAVAILIGAIVVGLIARAVLNSLRVLRRSALEVARVRLPEAVRRMRTGNVPDVDVTPVPITTNEEIGEVARAFDAVHTEAVRLAAEQATLQNSVNRMFINLSRRSKSLVDKQLQLIEGLERDEQNSDQLSALFRLDHLATRMRRNSDNLLVLAGTELPAWSSQPVSIVDVMRAAISEIESYQRIVVNQPPQVVVAGWAANDLQHLFAELLDNATSFSPPDSQVVMSAGHIPSGDVVVEIADRGVGMPPEELIDANAQIGRTNVASADTGRRMGLLVVGRLAARHDVHVELVGTPAHGLTARVTIPARLVNRPGQGPGQVRRPAPPPRQPVAAMSGPATGPSGLPKRTPARPIGPTPGPEDRALFTARSPVPYEPADAPQPSAPPTTRPAVHAPAAMNGAPSPHHVPAPGVPSHSASSHSVSSHSVSAPSVPSHSVPSHSVPSHSVPFHSVPSHSGGPPSTGGPAPLSTPSPVSTPPPTAGVPTGPPPISGPLPVSGPPPISGPLPVSAPAPAGGPPPTSGPIPLVEAPERRVPSPRRASVPRLTNPENGDTRHYRPVAINWAPGPGGTMPPDETQTGQ